MEAHKATFDWSRVTLKLKYQIDGLKEETRLPVCRVVSDVELIPGSVNNIRIDLSGLD